MSRPKGTKNKALKKKLEENKEMKKHEKKMFEKDKNKIFKTLFNK